ncbi:MAG: leucine-rich repeat protein, partial [Ruminiclostridium sp.]|nr:leucine-rich repeat protein [Ruminiclostridium sp.]
MIIDYTGNAAEIEIPAEINGKKVSKVYGFSESEELTSVIISEGIEIIGSSAFRDCASLQSVTIPESVQIIEHYAFPEHKLTITIPDTVLRIEAEAFSKDTVIICGKNTVGERYAKAFGNEYMYLLPNGSPVPPDYVETFQSAGYTYKELDENCISIISYSGDEKDVVIPGKIDGKTVSAIDGKAFYRTDVTSVVIPYGVSFVGYMAFGDCDKLVSVSLPDTLSEMGKYVFSGCDSLKNINLPQGLVNIGEFAFENCKSLEEITVQSPIHKFAFRGCNALKKVKLTKDVLYIEESAFVNCTSLQEIVLPENLYELQGGAFDGCTSLKSVYISKDLTDIGDCYPDEDEEVSTIVSPFVNCTSLESVEVDPENDSLYSIDGVLFSREGNAIILYPEGKKDALYEIPEGTKVIGSVSQAAYTVFEGNKYLETVQVPKSVIKIGDLAFANIEGELRVEFSEDMGAIEIATNAFNQSPDLVVCCAENSAIHGFVMALG